LKRPLVKTLLLLLFVMTFLISCDSLSTSATTTDSTSAVTESSTGSSTASISSSEADAVYNLSSDELSAYLANLETTDPAIAATIVMPSVVEITVEFEYSYTSTYRSPWGTTTDTVTNSATSEATGFFINSDGYLVTNAHVVALTDYEDYTDFQYVSRTVSFSFADSSDVYTATIVAYDTELDLAVLKSDTVFSDQSYLTFFGIDSTNDVSLYYGEDVIAVGNANGYGISVTSGVVSAPLRYFQDGSNTIEAIQTDAAINSGNSGGPLTNLYGAVIGINSFKIVTSTSESLGYAIPSNVVMDYLDDLGIGYSVTTDRAYLS